jgi:hypothetical protein
LDCQPKILKIKETHKNKNAENTNKNFYSLFVLVSGIFVWFSRFFVWISILFLIGFPGFVKKKSLSWDFRGFCLDFLDIIQFIRPEAEKSKNRSSFCFESRF